LAPQSLRRVKRETNEVNMDISAVIDRQPLNGFHRRVLLLCVLVSMLDGMDTQSIGIAAVPIAAHLGFGMSEFGPIFASGLLGAAVGAWTFGPLADWFGRKSMLVAATFYFGIFTLLTAYASSYGDLIVIRFVAGIGLGGATPCFISLMSEYAPASRRKALVSVVWAGFPAGFIVGGFINSYLIEHFSWQALFYAGGVLPLVATALLVVFLPESLRYLALCSRNERRIFSILRRVAPNLAIGDIELAPAASTARIWLGELFSEGRAIPTLLLWVPFFLAFGTLALVSVWTPGLLQKSGMSASLTALAVACHGFGALIGVAAAGRLMERFGAAAVLVPAFAAGAVATAALGTAQLSFPLAATFMGLVGVFIGLGASGITALSAGIYPTRARSTGVGSAMGMGRFGQFVSPLLLGLMLKDGWDMSRMFLVIAIAPFMAALFVILLQTRLQRTEILTRAADGL
jgi:AAHS family 4-hydroxybenzoate transporter-like MFS transporter